MFTRMAKVVAALRDVVVAFSSLFIHDIQDIVHYFMII